MSQRLAGDTCRPGRSERRGRPPVHGAARADPQTWSSDWHQGVRTLEVYPDVDAMAAHLPPRVVDAVRRALATPPVEELDI